MKISLLFLAIFSFQASFSQKQADLIIYNARIYTVDERFSIAASMAVKDGKILETGKDLRKSYKAKTVINAEGKFIYPGLIDAHAHFYRYGLGLSTANLTGTGSWNEILQNLTQFSRTTNSSWIQGRGWDQNDWEVKEFPDNRALDSLFPNKPVLLIRVDGHAAIANTAALNLAGIKPGMTITGGTFETKGGRLTGLLIDNAIDQVTNKIPEPSDEEIKQGLMLAQKNCFAVGLTTVDDCGINWNEVLKIDSLQKRGELKMRIYAMLSDSRENYNWIFKRGMIKTPYLNVRSFKVYADGALGSRGAALLAPYSDRPDWSGFLLSKPSHFDSVAALLYAKNYQMCTHAIGDSGNRTVLNIYAKYLKGKNSRRWRIEHAQVVNSKDFSLFGRYNIIPSVQPTHATSDMYWAGERIGKEREKGAYAFNDLKKQNGWIPLGTDFPVEDISPFKTFYAAVFRIDSAGFPAGGYQKENSLSRMDALKGMTIWAARSNFEEGEKGSLQKGKLADFIILDIDLMKADPDQVLNAKVHQTWLGGKLVYSQN